MTSNPQHIAIQANADRQYNAIDVPRRREILRVLAGRDGVVDLTSLAERLEGRLRETEDRQADAYRIAVSLRHVDLPKLDEVGFVEYDDQTRLVSITDQGAALEFVSRERPDE